MKKKTVRIRISLYVMDPWVKTSILAKAAVHSRLNEANLIQEFQR